MRRLAVALAVLTLGLLVTIPATGLPGLDPNGGEPEPYFELDVDQRCCIDNGESTFYQLYDSHRFIEADGWDFGDRYGYTCAWVEFFQGTDEKFEVHYELVDYTGVVPDKNVTGIVDRFGLEDEAADKPGAPGDLCGDGIQHNLLPVGPEDHFPHGDYFDLQGTPVADLVFFQGGAEIARIDYSQGDPCDSAYWTPGDEPGESILWWDPDGPSSPDGHAALNCDPATGPEPPHMVLYARVKNADPDITYCVLDFPNQCAGAAFTTGPPTTTATTTIPTTTPPPTVTVTTTVTVTAPPGPTVTLAPGVTRLVCSNASVPKMLSRKPLTVSCP